MIVPSERELNALLRNDFTSFLYKVFNTLCPGQEFHRNWSIEACAHLLDRVRAGEINRLAVAMPPRSLKSMIVSVALPAFLLGREPRKRIICVSYSTDLARKFSNDFRAIVESAWYQALFPATRISQYKNSETEIQFTQHGYRLATSITGTLTGRGGDIIIIDDPLKPIDALSEAKRSAVNQWYGNTLISRLDNKRKGVIILAMQRVHMDDLFGHVTGQSDEWATLVIPAIAESDETYPLTRGRTHYRRVGEVLSPEREPLSILTNIRTQLGSDLFAAQYQQSPAPPGGAMVKRAWVKRYNELPTDHQSRVILQSWDTAARGGPDNDWSVCTTWYVFGERFYLVDVWRDRVDYPSLKAKVQELALQWGAMSVLVEEAGTALGLIDELQYKVNGLTGVKPEKDKQTRMSIASAKFEAGQVFLPENAPWLAELEAELFAFPAGRHDDQVDSISQAINSREDISMWIRAADGFEEFTRLLGVREDLYTAEARRMARGGINWF